MDDIDSSSGAVAPRALEMGSIGVSTPWKPIQLVFKRYLPQKGSDSKVRVAVKKPVSVVLFLSGTDYANFNVIFECIKAKLCSLCDIFCIGDSENR